MKGNFPWSAVVGQDRLKLALLLCAIDPAIGGVLVQGQRGVAKSTLARALGDLVGGPFVELPLGATEDRVAGTLDLGKALADGRVEFSPGLLARAHGGVMYIDEVNLLADALVDLLLDAAASGRNTVERDAVSHVHPARFVLVGTMNPDEGDLRPQLTDRFGLCVVADGQLQPEIRHEIILRRLEFDRDPDAFRSRFAAEQMQLGERCRVARDRAQTIAMAGPAVSRVVDHCYAAGVEGVRGDLAMLRAARAHAAWFERDAIALEDVDAVVELALSHRRSGRANPPPTGGGQASGETPGGRSGSRTSDGSPGISSGHVAGATTGALDHVPVRSSPHERAPRWMSSSDGSFVEPRRRGERGLPHSRGSRSRDEGERGAIDWAASLARRPRPRLHELRYRACASPPRELWILAIDCSRSMLRGRGLARAKGVAQSLEREAVRRGVSVAVISFGGDRASVDSGSKGARGLARRAIQELSAGGGTPLRHAVEQALELCDARSFRSSTVRKRILVATDGRSRQSIQGLAVGRPDVEWLVVDCECGTVRLGRAPALARELGARYVHVEDA